MESPKERMSMEEVNKELQLIKNDMLVRGSTEADQVESKLEVFCFDYKTVLNR